MITEPCCDGANLGSIAVDLEVARCLGLDPRASLQRSEGQEGEQAVNDPVAAVPRVPRWFGHLPPTLPSLEDLCVGLLGPERPGILAEPMDSLRAAPAAGVL